MVGAVWANKEAVLMGVRPVFMEWGLGLSCGETQWLAALLRVIELVFSAS